MKAALYVRVSTDEQAKKYSIPAQLELLRNFAKANNYEVFKEYIDKGQSGTLSERPQLQELLNDARRGMFKAVLVYRIDRFFRDTRKLLNTVDELTKVGVSFKSITEPFDTSNPMGSFMVSLLGSVAQLERDTLIERSRMGMVKSAQSGHVLTGNPRYGYTYDKEKLCYEINEEEAKVVREIFRLYIQEDSSLLKVSQRLNELGYRRASGGRWASPQVHKILLSPVYHGDWCYHTKYHSEPIMVKVPPIVDKGLSDRAQRLLRERRVYAERNTKNEYLLSHLLRCGICGRRLASRSGSVKYIRRGKTFGPYEKNYYYCFGRTEKKCTLPYIRVAKIDPLVWSKVKEILENPSLLVRLMEEQTKRGKGERITLAKRLKRIDREIEQRDQEKENVLRAFRKGILDDAELASQMGEIRREEQALGQEKEEIGLQIRGQKQIKERLCHLGHLVKGMEEKLDGLSFEKKRELLRTLVDKVTIYENGRVELKIVVPDVMPTVSRREKATAHSALVHSESPSAGEGIVKLNSSLFP